MAGWNSSVGWRGVPAALWSRRTWLAAAHLGVGSLLWLLVLSPAAVLAPAAWALINVPVLGELGGLDGPLGALARLGTWLAALLIAALVSFAFTSRFTGWQRARFTRLLGEALVPVPDGRPDQPRWRWLADRVVGPETRRQFRYHALAGAVTTLAAVLFLAALTLGGGLLALSLSSGKLHPGSRVAVALLGAAALVAATWLARGAAAVDLRLARALLQPSGTEALARRVESLSASRAGAIAAADAERRRIERDLHDGTQQRLVSLAMNLGMTRAALRDADPEVRRAVADAHEEAKQVLVELRGLIRGLHPAVLDELGLDAALSGIAARCPVPVKLRVELPERPPPAVEAVAYFVVSEALTNVARHAMANRAEVVVRRQPGGLFLSVTDDGRGGADPLRGTGLRGLRQRVDSVDGELRIDSPAGGPTSIVVTVPCGS
ncbi:sensor histidine kinase [Plantactinospora siamensis]|uniref:histidine kinase n=1 Tax=Plantactinospora siamensis TaxID=555372 RepID=A0ABV6NTT9_9ACTN